MPNDKQPVPGAVDEILAGENPANHIACLKKGAKDAYNRRDFRIAGRNWNVIALCYDALKEPSIEAWKNCAEITDQHGDTFRASIAYRQWFENTKDNPSTKNPWYLVAAARCRQALYEQTKRALDLHQAAIFWQKAADQFTQDTQDSRSPTGWYVVPQALSVLSANVNALPQNTATAAQAWDMLASYTNDVRIWRCAATARERLANVTNLHLDWEKVAYAWELVANLTKDPDAAQKAITIWENLNRKTGEKVYQKNADALSQRFFPAQPPRYQQCMANAFFPAASPPLFSAGDQREVGEEGQQTSPPAEATHFRYEPYNAANPIVMFLPNNSAQAPQDTEETTTATHPPPSA